MSFGNITVTRAAPRLAPYTDLADSPISSVGHNDQHLDLNLTDRDGRQMTVTLDWTAAELVARLVSRYRN